jgi:hypothetical protein
MPRCKLPHGGRDTITWMVRFHSNKKSSFGKRTGREDIRQKKRRLGRGEKGARIGFEPLFLIDAAGSGVFDRSKKLVKCLAGTFLISLRINNENRRGQKQMKVELRRASAPLRDSSWEGLSWISKV